MVKKYIKENSEVLGTERIVAHMLDRHSATEQ